MTFGEFIESWNTASRHVSALGFKIKYEVFLDNNKISIYDIKSIFNTLDREEENKLYDTIVWFNSKNSTTTTSEIKFYDAHHELHHLRIDITIST